jgi:hypothetical protein
MQNLEVITLEGGVDQVTPPIAMKQGRLILATNYEADINGGYTQMRGYERFDGRQSPSRALYYVAAVNITGSITAGDTITGATSSATAIVLQVNGTTELILTAVTGTFVAEDIEVSAVVEGTISAVVESGATNNVDHTEYRFLAAEHYRAIIGPVPGSGPVRGVYNLFDDIYALRDNVGATACVMHKATASGWTAIAASREIQFDDAVGEIFEGDTVTGLTSSATGEVKRALLRSGTWTSSGVGTLVFDTITGTFQDNEALQVGGVTKATADGADNAVTLLPGGRFTFDNYNFTAATATLRMYFADGVNEIHEFDGTRLVPIRTGVTGSKPKFVLGHRNHLVCAIESSLQVSSTGEPYSWTALTGAAELGLGDTCTGILRQTGDQNTGVLFALTETKTFILYGNDASDFNLVLHSAESGGFPYTLQNIGSAYYLDSQGVVAMNTTQAFGGFEMTGSTRAVQRFIDLKRGKASASCIVRSKNQYRVFFNDGSGLILHAKPSGKGGMTMEPTMFELTPEGTTHLNGAFSFVDTSGRERIFGAGSDGYVYELDAGTSADGEEWEYSLFTVFAHSKSPRDRKRYRRTILQFEANGLVELDIGYDLSFGGLDPSYGQVSRISSDLGRGDYWGNFIWGHFSWGAPYAQEFNIDTPGTGTSIAIVVSGSSKKNEPHKLHTALIHYLPGRRER